MEVNYYTTSLGIVIKDNNSIRLKSSYIPKIITQEEFENSDPIRIKKHKYLEMLNEYFRNSKYEWEYEGEQFKKLDNFVINKNGKILNYEEKDINFSVVMYQNRLYSTHVQGNYYPQMQLYELNTQKPSTKWTSIKNLCPIFNKTKKEIVKL